MRLHGGYLKRDISKFGKIKKERLNTLTTVSVNVRQMIEEKINSKKFELQQNFNNTKEIKYSPILVPQNNTAWEDKIKATSDSVEDTRKLESGGLQLRHFLYPITITSTTPSFPKSLCNVQLMKNSNILETRAIMVTKQKPADLTLMSTEKTEITGKVITSKFQYFMIFHVFFVSDLR